MKLLNEADIVDNEEKTLMFMESVESLLGAGYEYLGVESFAKPHDALAQALREKRVWRNFSGFTPGHVHNMIGVGASATSAIGNCYAQNVYDLFAYQQAGVGRRFPIERGLILSDDDVIRREVIFGILCDRALDWRTLGKTYRIDPGRYFEEERDALKEFVDDGLILSSEDSLTVTEKGRFFIRHIAKVFDAYVKAKAYQIHGT